jgi:phosphoglycolate phosphatase-like HAD superfamily hydrolase
MLKAVIFDIDGTLISSVDLHAQSWKEALAHFGVQAEFEDLRRRIGEGADHLMPAFLPPATPPSVQKRIEEFRSNLFKRGYLPKVRPFPGVRELFEQIHADGCKIVLASSCAASEIGEYKAIAGISDMTDCDVTADDADSSKPAPDIFLTALERISPISASETCVVGDTKYDGEGARRAGIPFVGVACGGSTRQELERSGAIAVYRDPSDLLKNWNRWRDLSTRGSWSRGELEHR